MQLTDCDCTAVCVGISAILVVGYLLLTRKPRNFPPGPSGLPVLGYVPFLGSNKAETLRKLKSKYGPVMSVRMGMENWVVLNDFESINEGLVKQGDTFSGRPSNVMFDLVTDGRGLAMADYGSKWKSLRRFGLMTLRGFGVGKKSMEDNVVEEMPYLVENLTSSSSDSLATKLTLSVSNIICGVVFGERFDYDDKRFTTLIRILREFFSDSPEGKLFGAMTAIPVLRFFPPFRGAFKREMVMVEEFMGNFRGIIEEHKSSFDENDLRDFTDAFLKEIKNKGDRDPSFCDAELLQYIRDLFEAGTGTTSSTLTWAILAILNYPECQEKISEEVIAVIGEDGRPTMKHRDEMPYTCAFIQEIMRHRTLVPMSVMHKTNAKVTINGYTIPQNTTVVPNIWAVHHDPDIFDSPSDFRPERFLDKDGKFIKSKHVIPFSLGPRHCLGEQLARMEIFIFLTSLVQKLKFLPDHNHPPPSLSYGNVSVLTLEPPEFKVKIEKR